MEWITGVDLFVKALKERMFGIRTGFYEVLQLIPASKMKMYKCHEE